MKKYILTIAILLVVLGASFAAATDVAYVVKNSPESKIVGILNGLNLSYTVIPESSISSVNYSAYKVILVGEGKFTNYQNIPVADFNSVVVNSEHYYEKGTVTVDKQWGWSKEKGTQSSPSLMFVNNPSHTVTKNLNQSFNAYTIQNVDVSSNYLKATKPTGIQLLVQVYGPSHTSSDSAIAVLEPGRTFLNGKVAKGRGVFFGLVDSAYWTAEAEKAFKNSLMWAIQGEDKDNDGFYTDKDCNDNNATINPNATEIPYDGIDQDCNGSDLRDVDNDGFFALVVVGPDCNDNNATINPNNPDPKLNCVNDAPTISNIPDQISSETKVVKVNISASDPENNTLTYFINDTRFIKVGNNAFEWQTSFGDEGIYFFRATVSDGQYNASDTFKVTIFDKNRVPNSTFIPPISWPEDTKYSLNLSQYFFDEDEDSLEFGVNSTSTNTKIVLESIQNGIANFSVQQDWNGQDWIVFFATDNSSSTTSNQVILNVTPVNDAPFLKQNISNQSLNEDELFAMNMINYFGDIDSSLSYSLYGNSHINSTFVGNLLTLMPEGNWTGSEEVYVVASDGEFNVTGNNFTLKVNPINDAPSLEKVDNIVALAGSLIKVIPNATDIDTPIENLTYTYGVPLNSSGEWQTSELNFGNYTSFVRVSDGNKNDTKIFGITLLQKVLINEISSAPVSGNDWFEIYNPFEQEFNLGMCKVIDGSGNELALEGTIDEDEFKVFNWSNRLNNEGDSIELNCFNQTIDKVSYGNFDDGNLSDNAVAPEEGKSIGRVPDGKDTNNDFNDFVVLNIPTPNLNNNADMVPPVVTLLSPSNGLIIDDTRDVALKFKVVDDSLNLTCSFYGNFNSASNFEQFGSKVVANDTQGEFSRNNLVDRNYMWNVKCKDANNEVFSSQNFSFIISAPDTPTLNSIGSKNVNENQSLEFLISASDPDNDTLTFSAEGLPEGATVGNNGDGTGIFSWLPGFNQSGIYKITFFVTDMFGLKDSEEVIINVNNVKEPPKFDDAEVCVDKNSNLEIKIKDPDNNDEFAPGETIEFEIEFENNLDKDLDLDFEVHLYDLDDENSEDSIDDDMDVDEGDREDFEGELKVPLDVENSNFAIYVFAEDKDEDVCNSVFVEIDIEREDHDVRITKFDILPSEANKGEFVEFRIEVSNIGDSDEDVYVTLTNVELGISEKSEEFELEKFDDDDRETITFNLEIPREIEAKVYDFTAEVVYDDGKDSATKSLSVLNDEIKEVENVNNSASTAGTISLGGKTLSSLNRIFLEKEESYESPIVLTKKNGKEIKLGSTTTSKDENPKTMNFTFEGKNFLEGEEWTRDKILWIVDLLLAIGILVEIICFVLLRRQGRI